MRTIVTAITAAALALSLTFQAAPANAAVPGYDSSYAGESAFLNLDQGDSGSFTVFFANTGTTTWTTGSPTQVDLAACLEDKVTCNQQDADEAAFSDGWLSATRYATHTQTSVAPGQIGTFTYDVMVPSDAAADTYRFNGALVLASTGADIHNEGYFQDVTVAGGAPAEGAATIDELDPESGDVEGGTTVVITGEDIDCTPTFPTVMFGDNEAEVVSCGPESLTVETPAGDAVGDVDVTVTNAGAAASNALTFEYEDVSGPDLESVSVSGQTVTLTFSEAVCTEDGSDLVLGTDFTVRVNGENIPNDASDEIIDADMNFIDCDAAAGDRTSTATFTFDTSQRQIAEGDTVSVTITNDGADADDDSNSIWVEDVFNNDMETAQTRSGTAAADTTRPTATSATVTAANNIRVTFSEPVYCPTGTDVEESFTWDEDGTASDGDVTDSDCSNADNEDDDASEADTTINLTVTGVSQGDSGELTYTASSARPIQDLAGNTASSFEIQVTALEADPPLIDDAQLTANGTGGFAGSADSGDAFELDFSEDMANPTTTSTIRVQDADGTIADILCSGAPNAANEAIDAVCVEDADDDTVWTITLAETPEGGGGANDDLIAVGDTPGLQWPATIIDTSNVEDDEGNDVDLGDSDDIVIDDE